MTDLSLARIAEAARAVDPVFRDTPQYTDDQLNVELGRDVVVKVETVNPLGSFKGRGAAFFAHRLLAECRRTGAEPPTLVCATSGNFGPAMAYAARARGLDVHVFVIPGVNPAKRARMAALGARVLELGDGGWETLEAYAAAAPNRLLVTGAEPEIAEGAATIGVELLAAYGGESESTLDAVVLPVGGGALATGVARWVKAHSPATRVVGAVAERSPATALSWRAGHPVSGPTGTVAEGIATEEPRPEVVRRLRELVDDMVLVADEEILHATGLAARTLGLWLEPTGAVGLAAVAGGDVPGRRVATVLTGAGPRSDLWQTILGI
jgi:threonine dehydratase